MSISPANRAKLHNLLDHALNVGAPVTVNVHPRYPEDLDALILRAGVPADPTADYALDEDGSILWHDFTFNPEDARHPVQVTLFCSILPGPRPGPTGPGRAQVRPAASHLHEEVC